MDTSELLLKLSKEEFVWIRQEVNRRIKSIEHLLGGLSVEERKRAARYDMLPFFRTFLSVAQCS